MAECAQRYASVLILVAVACTFGSEGGSNAGSAGFGEEDTTSAISTDGVADDGAPTSATAASGAATSAGSNSTGGGSTSATSAGDDSGPTTATNTTEPPPSTSTTTNAGFDCESGESFSDLRTVPEATLVEGAMATQPAWGGLPGQPDAAWSAVAGDGAITFEVDVPCERTYFLSGLTWDHIHGVSNCSGTTNADAYMVSVDGGPEIQWAYGCQGCSNADDVWTWTIVHEYMASGCVTNLWSLALPAGTHAVRFRNLDAGSFDLPNPNVAAIAAMAISDDAAWLPSWP